MYNAKFTALSSLFKGEVAILNYGLLIMSTVYLRCKGRLSYLNPCYLTTSCRTPNQVMKNIFVWRWCFCSHFARLWSLTLCSGAIVYILTKDHFRVQKLSIFTTELWVLICAMQQHDPQKQAGALEKALFSEYHTCKCPCSVIVWTGQRKHPRPFYIPADYKEVPSVDKSLILICESHFYMFSG